jgi:hypothetical protein
MTSSRQPSTSRSVGNVFDPAYTMVAKIEKALLERL